MHKELKNLINYILPLGQILPFTLENITEQSFIVLTEDYPKDIYMYFFFHSNYKKEVERNVNNLAGSDRLFGKQVSSFAVQTDEVHIFFPCYLYFYEGRKMINVNDFYADLLLNQFQGVL